MEKHLEGFGFRCKAADFWPITKEGLKDALTYAPKTMNKIQALAAEHLPKGVQLYDLDITEICELFADHSDCQEGLFWLLKNLISEREGIDLLFTQDYEDSDFYILAYPVKDNGQDIRCGNWPDIRQRMQDVYLRYQSILGIWKECLTVPWYVYWTEKEEETFLLDPDKREFEVTTPIGNLRVYAKHDIDNPADYPGVWVEFISPYTKESVGLVCVEYCPGEEDCQNGYIALRSYKDAEIDEPYDNITFENLDIYDLDAAKQMINDFCKKEYNCGEEWDEDFADLTEVNIARTDIEGTDEELEVQMTLDLLSHACVTKICIPGMKRHCVVRRDQFDSLKQMIEELISVLDFDSLVSLEKAEWDEFSSSEPGKLWLAQKYPAGTRICLDYMDDPYPVEPGTEGTVESIDGVGTIHVVWDNHRTLSLAFGVDGFHLVEKVPAEAKVHPPVYTKPWSAATFFGEVKEYRDSMNHNFACAEQISKTISRCYVDFRLKSDLVLDILEPEFGLERITFVLANTIRAKMQDGRIDRANKEWAYTVNIPGDDKGNDYIPGLIVDNQNPGLVNLLVTALRKRLSAEKKEVQ